MMAGRTVTAVLVGFTAYVTLWILFLVRFERPCEAEQGCVGYSVVYFLAPPIALWLAMAVMDRRAMAGLTPIMLAGCLCVVHATLLVTEKAADPSLPGGNGKGWGGAVVSAVGLVPMLSAGSIALFRRCYAWLHSARLR